MSQTAIIVLAAVGILIGLIVLIVAIITKRFWKLLGVLLYDVYGIYKRFTSQKTSSIVIAILEIISGGVFGFFIVLDFITVFFTGKIIGGQKKNKKSKNNNSNDEPKPQVERTATTYIESNNTTSNESETKTENAPETETVPETEKASETKAETETDNATETESEKKSDTNTDSTPETN